MNPLRALPARLESVVWSPDVAQRPRAQRVLAGCLQYLWVTLRDLAGGDITLRAGSLAYTTLLSFVPLLAVSFSVLKGFGVHNQLEPLLARLLAPLGAQGAGMTATIVGFVENMKVGVLGAVGLVTLLYTVVSTMQKIESAFNHSWRIRAVRTPVQRFSDYLSVLIVGPVLVFAALGITGIASSNRLVSALAGISFFGALFEHLARLLPYVMIIAAFTFIYLFMPNTRVRLRSALFGGVVGGVLWQTTGWGFARFVAGSTQYAAVYSAFAGLMIFFVWIYMAWLILLTGANVAFYHQHPEHRVQRRREPGLSVREGEALALWLFALIATAHERGAAPWTLPALARELRVPMDLLRPRLAAFERAGLLSATAERLPVWLPTRSSATISAAEVLAAVRGAGDEGLISARSAAPGATVAWLEEAEQAAQAVLARHAMSGASTAPGARS